MSTKKQPPQQIQPSAQPAQPSPQLPREPVNDPLAPTYALGALRGVPEGARFLRVKLDRPMVRASSPPNSPRSGPGRAGPLIRPDFWV